MKTLLIILAALALGLSFGAVIKSGEYKRPVFENTKEVKAAYYDVWTKESEVK